MRKEEILDYFGNLLIKNVRDQNIYVWNKMLNGKMKGETAEKVGLLIKDFDDNQVENIKILAYLVIDNMLHDFLFMFEDTEEFDIEFLKNNKNFIELKKLSDGLHGELYTEDGWIAKYSKYPKEE